MHSLVTRCFCASLMLSALAHTAEQNDTFTPASFTDDKRSLQNRIRFPDTEGDVSALVRCDTHLSRYGIAGTLFCFPDPDDKEIGPYLKSVQKALRRSRLKPAQVNGKRVGVYFQFSVLFERANGHESISVFPSHLYEQERLGPHYSSPQRYDRGRRWRGCRDRTLLWIAMQVDEYGTPSGAKIVAGDAHDRCKSMLLEFAEAESFIPAMQDGVAVAANYLECFWTRDKEQLIRQKPRKEKQDSD